MLFFGHWTPFTVLIVKLFYDRLQEMQQMDIYHYTHGLGTEFLHDVHQ